MKQYFKRPDRARSAGILLNKNYFVEVRRLKDVKKDFSEILSEISQIVEKTIEIHLKKYPDRVFPNTAFQKHI
ncbi:MAG: hypothetical protein ACTSW6_03320 [Candidatus Baldrarchaeia archaeon]